ncbi:endonuclease/exonuclease/phosphatase family protein [Proteiniphilum sp. UBA5310]|jgi:endonuclease/exonuclease/phosphatase family metal-dependent hydrolase|uniref:endonuclease/exonuclease/phosphatase family protein n=1 Tax=Proteiniphilum sp. UBA5310 TaxID=1947275 RepID=UPI00258053FC|nr:endonuclease/exonuclease/phosphatase family protein [Proteiniphilum sp. UBA5310]
MKTNKIFFSIFLILFFIGCNSSEHITNVEDNKKETAKFKVASYNIRCDVTSDILSGNAWEIRKKPLVELIVNCNFDIVGIQEPYQNQLDDLQDMLINYNYISAPYATKSFLAIYYKKDLFDVLDKGMFWLSETPDVPSIGWDADELRIVHWAKFKHKESKKEFYFFNTHFYWRYQTARKNSGPLTARKINDIAGNVPVIFVGDLNSRPSTTQIDRLKVDLNDTFDITETPRVGPDKTNLPGGVFVGPLSGRIDYIFVSKDIRVFDFTVHEDKYGEDNRYPSDHLPLSSNIEI